MRCHRCGASLSAESLQDLGRDVVDFARLGLRGWRCRLCQWPNLADVPSRRADLRRLTGELAVAGAGDGQFDFGASIPADTAVETAGRAVQALWRMTYAQLRKMIEADPQKALGWLLESLGGVQREPSMLADEYALVVQVVYASLLASSPLNVFAPQVTPDKEWSHRFGTLAAGLVTLADLERSLDPEICASCVMDKSTIEIIPTDTGRFAYETDLYNCEAFGESDRDLSDPTDIGDAVREVEKACFGTSVDEVLDVLLTSLSNGGEPLSALTRVTVNDGIMYVDLRIDRGPHPLVRLLREVFVLNPHHWRVRAVPSFFFADARPVERTDEELVKTASSLDWLRFAPLLCGAYIDGGELHVVGVTTYGLLWRALQRCRGALSNRLHLTEMTARARWTQTGAGRAVRAQEVHTAFERSIVQRCQSVGVAARHSLERIAGKVMPCGEIDFLAFTTDNMARPVVIVGECKDVDVVFYKDGGINQAIAVATHAAEQVQRKAIWLHRNWEAVADSVDGPRGTPIVVGVVVTRNAALPTVHSSVPVLHPEEIPSFIHMLRNPLQPLWPVLAQQQWFES